MIESEAFKKGQEDIKRNQKKWLSTNAKLDIILKAINHELLKKETYEEIQERVEDNISLSIKEIVQFVQKMVVDGYITEEIIDSIPCFYISANGKVFIEDNGYEGQSKRRTRNKIWDWIKIVVVSIQGLVLFYIAVLSFYKESDKKNNESGKIIFKGEDAYLKNVSQTKAIKFTIFILDNRIDSSKTEVSRGMNKSMAIMLLPEEERLLGKRIEWVDGRGNMRNEVKDASSDYMNGFYILNEYIIKDAEEENIKLKNLN